MSIGRVMADNDTAAGSRPLLVIDVLDLMEHVREWYSDSEDYHRGYTEPHDWNKTDIAGGTNAAVVASRIVLPGDVRAIGGWSLTETTGAAVAGIRLRDGGLATGEEIVRVSVPSGATSVQWPFGKGVRVQTGRIFLEVIAGSVEGVVYWR